MTRPLSIDLRERVVAAIVGGASCRVVATRFGVAVSSVVKWSRCQTLGVSFGGFAIDKKSDAFLEREGVEIR
jgi:transposase-like protein